VTSGTFLEHIRPAVGCPGRNSRKPGTGWCRRSIGERRNWLFALGHTAVQGCWMLPRSPSSHRQEMFCHNPVDMLSVEVTTVAGREGASSSIEAQHKEPVRSNRGEPSGKTNIPCLLTHRALVLGTVIVKVNLKTLYLWTDKVN